MKYRTEEKNEHGTGKKKMVKELQRKIITGDFRTSERRPANAKCP